MLPTLRTAQVSICTGLLWVGKVSFSYMKAENHRFESFQRKFPGASERCWYTIFHHSCFISPTDGIAKPFCPHANNLFPLYCWHQQNHFPVWVIEHLCCKFQTLKSARMLSNSKQNLIITKNIGLLLWASLQHLCDTIFVVMPEAANTVEKYLLQ